MHKACYDALMRGIAAAIAQEREAEMRNEECLYGYELER